MSRDTLFIAPIPANDVKQQIASLENSEMLAAVVGGFLSENGIIRKVVECINGHGGKYTGKLRHRLVCTAIRKRTVFPAMSVLSQRLRPRYWRAKSDVRWDQIWECYDRYASQLLGPGIRAVVGREDCCERSFAKAKSIGINRIYDLPTLYCDSVKRLLAKEIEEFPGAENELRADKLFSEDRCERKRRELILASHVVVASELVLRSAGDVISRDRIKVIPYGFEHIDPNAVFVPHSERQPHVIYGGNINLRKGIPRLLRAWRRIGAHRTHRLKLYGGMFLSPKFLADYQGTFDHVPRVAKSVLRDALTRAKGLVMPSIADGFGLIVSEAISVGTPVVVSNNTGSAEIVSEGLHGFRYEYDDDDGLCAALEKLLGGGAQRDEMSSACLELARSCTWEGYRKRFSEFVANASLPNC